MDRIQSKKNGQKYKKNKSIRKKRRSTSKRGFKTQISKKRIKGGYNEWKLHTFDNIQYKYVPEMVIAKKQLYPNSMKQFVGLPSSFYQCKV